MKKRLKELRDRVKKVEQQIADLLGVAGNVKKRKRRKSASKTKPEVKKAKIVSTKAQGKSAQLRSQPTTKAGPSQEPPTSEV